MASGTTSQTISNANTSTVVDQLIVPFTASANGLSITSNLTLTPANLRVTNVYRPNSVDLKWDAVSSNGFTLKRDGNAIATPNTGFSIYTDTFNFGNGQTVLYELYDRSTTPVLLSVERITLYQKNAGSNQAVDSRVDNRYPPTTYQDFQFGTLTYRGGLFAGFSNDPARIGRSFLLFNLDIPPVDGSLRGGSVNAYFTGGYTTGTGSVSIPVGAQVISNTTWNPALLKWTIAPTIDPTLGQNTKPTAPLTYNPTTPNPSWVYWDAFMPDIESALTGSHVLSVAIASKTETASGWAYFAKNEYMVGAYAPCITYAWSIPVLINLTLNPTSIKAGTGVSTGTIALNGIELTDVASVQVNASSSSIQFQGGHTVGSNYFVDVNGLNRTFTITSSAVAINTNVTITISYNGRTSSAVLTLTP